jgi:glycosyltransferase involved in cell wall biosynthesis
MSYHGISVIIPAYGVSEYISDCIGSIINQRTWVNIEILIGIDHCDSTRQKLNELKNNFPNNDHIKIRVFDTKESTNVGPYLIRNSLVKRASYASVLFFDADDIMMSDMVTNLCSVFDEDVFIRFHYRDFMDKQKTNYSRTSPGVAQGVFFCGVDLFNKIGGFQPWVCGADSEFIKRSHKNKIKTYSFKYPLFYRRIHKTSLTNSPETGRKSSIRDKYIRYIETNTDWSIPIDTKHVELTELF